MVKKALLLVGLTPDGLWLDLVSRALKALGAAYELRTSSTCETGDAARYELIVIDAATAGPELVPLTRQLHKECPIVPILVVSASPTWQQAREVFLAGAADYIRKAFDERAIRASLEELLGKRGG